MKLQTEMVRAVSEIICARLQANGVSTVVFAGLSGRTRVRSRERALWLTPFFHRGWFLPAWLLLFVTNLLFAQHSPDDALKSFRLADPSLHVELVASEPLVESPCAMAFDERGRLFVAENRGYPNTTEPPMGRIAMLEDTDGDGRMDKRTTFAEGLTYPNGVMPWRGGIIVTCAPDVLYFKDADGDGRAEERRVLLTGFDTKGSTQLRVNCPTVGPDGWIYLAAGLSGGVITCPEHPERSPLKMTADVRFNPETLEVENVDGRSQYGMSFDGFGRRFICMNRLPVQHVVLSSKWLSRNPFLAFSDTVQDCSERSVKTGLHGGGDGVRLYPISHNITTADSHAGSFSAACGIHIWQGETLPLKYRDCAFTCDPTANLVHVDQLVLNGPTFEAKPLLDETEFLASSDDWFRPVFISNGPDGALYVVDMTREIIEHPDYLPQEVRKHTQFGKGRDMGRIWRVIESQPPDTPRKLSLPKTRAPALFKQMDDTCGWLKSTVSRLLFEQRSHEVAWILRGLDTEKVSSTTSYSRLRMLDAIEPLSDEQLARFIDHADFGVKRAALEVAKGRIQTGSKARDAVLRANVQGDDLWFTKLLLLGEDDESHSIDFLSEWAAIKSDRWTRAAVLSGIAGRELAFLSALKRHELLPDSPIIDDIARMLARRTPSEELPGLAKRLAGEQEEAFLFAFLTEAHLKNRDITLALVDPGRLRLNAAIRRLIDSNGKDADLPMVALLSLADYADAAEPLAMIASEPDSAVQAAAIRALAGFSDAGVCPLLLADGKWTRCTPAQRETIIGALLANPAQLAGVLDAIESHRLPASAISAVQRSTFQKSKDPQIRERAGKLLDAASGDRGAAFEKAKAALGFVPNSGKGREVFRNVCAVCHRLEREGNAVGPDLFDIRNQPKENILFHIIVPDAEIAPAFTAYVVETKDGRNLAGLLASESSTSLTIRMPPGREETVFRTDVAKLEALPNSLMPSGLERTMTLQDLADLLGFLKGEK